MKNIFYLEQNSRMHICKKFNKVIIIITLLNMFYFTMYYSLVCCGVVAWLCKCAIYILLPLYVISKNNTEQEKGTYMYILTVHVHVLF